MNSRIDSCLEAFLGSRRSIPLIVILVVLFSALVSRPALAAEEGKITLDSSETLFSVLTALNSCGFDLDLANSDPIRQQVRNEVERTIAASETARKARENLCAFRRDKQLADDARDLAQYVSLALNLSPPPFAPVLKEADLPPDAANILGFVPLLQQFYDAVGLHQLWLRVQPRYEAMIAGLHEPIARMIFDTDLYLRLPLSGYVGRRFVVYVDPMGPPGQVNARNYASDYFMVISPGQSPVRLQELRHTYLHFILDPMILKRANTLKRLEPVLALAKTAPLEQAYKEDASLLVNESLIKAIEARMINTPADERQREEVRNNKVQEAMEQGFVLTRYFYEALREFEKGPVGFRDAFGDFLYHIDLGREKKRIEEITFRSQGSSEVLKSAKMKQASDLDRAEDALSKGDPETAYQLANQVLSNHSDDPARATFILAKAATLKKDIPGAEVLFQRTLEIGREPRMLAWSHIYLARILDLKGQREQALEHYRAALSAGDTNPDTRAAAEKGIQQPPPKREEQDKENQ